MVSNIRVTPRRPPILGNTIVQLSCIYALDLIAVCAGSVSLQAGRSLEMKRASYLRLRDCAGWHCDACDRLITSVSDGWVEWLASEDDTGATILNGLRLVHRVSCRYDARAVFRNHRSVVEGLCLERFMGSDGLILLLSLLAAGELPAAAVIDLAKRVQVPGYELARNLIGGENLPRVLVPSLGHGCYLQSEITELLTRAMQDQQAA
jgi:hypothetical protein